MFSRSYGRRFLVAGVAFAVLALIGGPLAAQQQAPFECNANLAISLSNPSPLPGETVAVTLELINGPSNDAFDNPIPQDYSLVSFFPSCLSTLPCTEDTAAVASFSAVTSNTCGVMVTATSLVVPPGTPPQTDLTFTPDPLMVPAPPNNAGTASCQIVLDVVINPAAMPGQTNNMEANTVGTCTLGSGTPQGASATATLTVGAVVPTLGEVAFVILALILAAGSWIILRRRSLPNGPVA